MTALLANAPGLVEATEPPEHRGIARDAVRLLVTDRATGVDSHARFYGISSYLRAGDVLVVNDSATMPAALRALRANGEAIGLHVSTRIDERVWMTEPRGRVSPGETLQLPGGASAVAIAPVDPQRPRLWYAAFALAVPMNEYLAAQGEPIRYGYVARRFPIEDYQTIFASEPGSSEMPSAARPFTTRVVTDLRRRGVALATITLHCGVSSFEAPERPPIERFSVSHETAELVNAARAAGRRIVAVGTTALRALESAVRGGRVVAASGWTDLVVDERHAPAAADALLTGFHDPSATHLWALRAFLDEASLARAYDAAANAQYRYHEFGDVHLIV